MIEHDWLNTLAGATILNKELADAMRQTLIDQDHVASGNLLNSVDSETYRGKNKVIRSVITALARGEDIDKRRYSVMITIPMILKWMSYKEGRGAKFNYKRKAKEPRRRIAYAIQRELRDNGTALSYDGKLKTGWISRNWEKHKINIDKRIAPYVLKDVVENINNILREFAAKNPNVKFFG